MCQVEKGTWLFETVTKYPNNIITHWSSIVHFYQTFTRFPECCRLLTEKAEFQSTTKIYTSIKVALFDILLKELNFNLLSTISIDFQVFFFFGNL